MSSQRKNFVKMFFIVVILVIIFSVCSWFSSYMLNYYFNNEVIKDVQEHTTLVDAVTVRYSFL